MQENLMIPLIYVLLPDKREVTYFRLLLKIKSLCCDIGLNFNPKIFSIDLESAVIKSIRNVFPAAEIRGCFFRFCQCIWRKTCNLGLKSVYSSNNGMNDINLAVRRLSCLAFVKPEDVQETFEFIILNGPEDDRMDELQQYFFSNFFKDGAKYPRIQWNHAFHKSPRTDNHLEGWHNAFNKAVGKAHPNIWFFIDKLRGQQSIYEHNLRLIGAGQTLFHDIKKYIAIERKIQNQLQKYHCGSINSIRFIDSIRYNITFSDDS